MDSHSALVVRVRCRAILVADRRTLLAVPENFRRVKKNGARGINRHVRLMNIINGLLSITGCVIVSRGRCRRANIDALPPPVQSVRPAPQEQARQAAPFPRLSAICAPVDSRDQPGIARALSILFAFLRVLLMRRRRRRRRRARRMVASCPLCRRCDRVQRSPRLPRCRRVGSDRLSCAPARRAENRRRP